MPIPPTAAPSGINAYRINDGRWEVTCGRCLRPSPPVAAQDAAHAWEVLQGLGWTWYRSPSGGNGYAICAKCTKDGLPEVLKRGVRRKRK